MRGTLKGDFTRLPFDRRKRYSAVRMQQGRVQLDADWNEQVDILSHRLRTGTVDLIGPSGAPAEAAGFGLEAEDGLVLGGEAGSFAMVGGAEGFTLPPEVSELTLETRARVMGDGPLLGLWVRGPEDERFRPHSRLLLAGGSPRFERAGATPVVPRRPLELAGRTADYAVSLGPRGVALSIDGRRVAVAEGAVELPGGRLLLVVGSRKEPATEAVIGSVRLWRDRPGRAAEEQDGGLLGAWHLGRASGETVAGEGELGATAVLRGTPRRLPLELTIGAGRYYVDGILCDNPTPVALTAQPDDPGTTLPQPSGDGVERHLLYLDVWERTVSAVQDPALAEPALGGPDTTTRCRVVSQVRCRRLEAEAAEEDEDLAAFLTPPAPGRLSARRRLLAPGELENVLYRVEVHDGGDGRPVEVERCDPNGRWLVLAAWDEGWQAGGVLAVSGERGGRRETWHVRLATVEREARRLTLTEAVAELAEAAGLSARRVATFKWSRHNASRVFPIAECEPGSGLVTLGPTPEGTIGLEVGGWVEVLDDRLELRGEARPLARVTHLDPSARQVALDPAPPPEVGSDPDRNPFLRLWDQRGREVGADGVVPATGDWQELEAGIQVRFAYDGPYRTGDYWWMPARTLTQEIEWPRDAEGDPEALPPHGVEHRRSPLALLIFEGDTYRLEDLRITFQPHAVDAVRKAGDWMSGPLDVRADLKVRGDLEVGGEGHFAGVHGPLRSADAVGTRQLLDGAVSAEKLAPAVGTVPDGTALLAPPHEHHPGYVETGWGVTLWQEDAPWVDRQEMPAGPPGPLVAVAVGGRVYQLLESGAMWLYDPTTNRWETAGSLPFDGGGFAAAVLGGRIHVAGGLDGGGGSSARHFVYDPATDAWSEAAALPQGRSDFALVVCEGRLHAIGGLVDSWLGKRVTARHDAYDPRTDRWSRRRALPRRLRGCGAAAVGHQIHVVGGETRWLWGTFGRVLVDAHHRYHPGSDRWLADRAPLPTPRRFPRLVEVFDQLFSVGGEAGVGWLADCERYDPGLDAWLARTPLHEPVAAPGVAAADGTLYTAGAEGRAGSGSVLMEACRVAGRFQLLERRAPEEGPGRGAPPPPGEASPEAAEEETRPTGEGPDTSAPEERWDEESWTGVLRMEEPED